MLFHSYAFGLFLVIVLIGHRLLSWPAARILLVACSYIFYGYANPAYVFLLAFSITFNYFIGLRMPALKEKNSAKFLLGAAIAVNLSFLALFKYANMFLEQVDTTLRAFGGDGFDFLLDWVLPVGISFYTFQAISYLVDLYYDRLAPCRDYIAFSLYISFFPQLVAGPIERASHMLPQFIEKTLPTSLDFYKGAERIFWGLIKKCVFADRMALIVNEIYARPVSMWTGAESWVCTLAFGMQIYLDFSAYSDIAIGVARLFGIRLMENFNAPYLARNVSDFWNRWHISLSTWLRDYLYIPLGGRKKGTTRLVINLFVVMLLGGLWHGASWHFVAWGFFHGLCLAIYHGLRLLREKFGLGPLLPQKLGTAISIFFTFIIVQIGWVFFRAPDMPTAFAVLGKMFGNFQGYPAFFGGQATVFTLLILAIILVHIFRGSNAPPRLAAIEGTHVARFCLRLTVMIVALIYFATETRETFIYFQF